MRTAAAVRPISHLGRPEARTLLTLGLIMALGVAIRIAYWGEPMRYDEAFSFLNYAMAPLKAITLTYSTPNNQILNTLFMHVAWQVFGVSMHALRLHVLAAGMVLPLVAYWVARQLYGVSGGLWAAALTATCSPLVDFSVNARGYELGALFILLCLGLGIRLVRTGGRWWARLFILSAGLALWSVSTMAYGLAAVGLWMVGVVALERPFNRGRMLQILGTVALAAAIGYVLYWPLIGQPGWNFIPPLPRTWAAIHPVLIGTWQLWNRTAFHPFDWLVALAFLGSLGLPWLNRRVDLPVAERLPLGVALLVALLAILVIAPLSPFARSYIGLLPLYLVAASGGLAAATAFAARRLRLSASAVSGAGAALLAIILSFSVLHGGELTSEEPPASDNNIVAILQTIHPPGGQVLIDQPTYGAGVDFYLFKTGTGNLVSGDVTSAQRATGQVFIIVPRNAPQIAISNVQALGGQPLPGQPPRLVRQMSYISIYDVSISH